MTLESTLDILQLESGGPGSGRHPYGHLFAHLPEKHKTALKVLPVGHLKGIKQYVVQKHFSGDDPDIQHTKGMYSFKSKTLAVQPTASIKTLIHEVGHHVLRVVLNKDQQKIWFDKAKQLNSKYYRRSDYSPYADRRAVAIRQDPDEQWARLYSKKYGGDSITTRQEKDQLEVMHTLLKGIK